MHCLFLVTDKTQKQAMHERYGLTRSTDKTLTHGTRERDGPTRSADKTLKKGARERDGLIRREVERTPWASGRQGKGMDSQEGRDKTLKKGTRERDGRTRREVERTARASGRQGVKQNPRAGASRATVRAACGPPRWATKACMSQGSKNGTPCDGRPVPTQGPFLLSCLPYLKNMPPECSWPTKFFEPIQATGPLL
jgi:hypothetical protein